LAWNIQRGCVVLPKSVSPDRLRENLDAVRILLDAPSARTTLVP